MPTHSLNAPPPHFLSLTFEIMSGQRYGKYVKIKCTDYHIVSLIIPVSLSLSIFIFVSLSFTLFPSLLSVSLFLSPSPFPFPTPIPTAPPSPLPLRPRSTCYSSCVFVRIAVLI